MVYNDFDKRFKDLKMPTKGEIREVLFENFEAFVGTQKQIDAERERLNGVDTERMNGERLAYNHARNEIENDFIFWR